DAAEVAVLEPRLPRGRLLIAGGTSGPRTTRCRAGEAAQSGHELALPAGRDRVGDELPATVAVLLHALIATLTRPCSRRRGTGTSWSCSSSSDRPARGRKNERPHLGQARAPAVSVPSCSGLPQLAQASWYASSVPSTLATRRSRPATPTAARPPSSSVATDSTSNHEGGAGGAEVITGSSIPDGGAEPVTMGSDGPAVLCAAIPSTSSPARSGAASSSACLIASSSVTDEAEQSEQLPRRWIRATPS